MEGWQKQYRFLFETFDALKDMALWSITDIMLDVFNEDFSLEGFRKYALAMPDDERIYKMADWYHSGKVSQKEIAAAISDDKTMDKLFSKVSELSTSFLGLSYN